MKKKIFLLPCIAAVAIATFVGAKSFQTNAYESNELLLANVEALSNPPDESGSITLWVRKDGDCVYEAKGKANSETTLQIGAIGSIKLKFNAQGVASYTAQNAKTNCEADGKEQCEAHYCPVAFWN